MIYHPRHGYLPWAADRAQGVGLFHVAALIRSAMGRIDALTAERDRMREALERIVAEQRVGRVDEIARAALKETSK